MDKPVDKMVLAPCPFCGSSEVSPSAWDVKCSGCGAEMPGSGEKAIAAWNRRSQPSLEGEMGEVVSALVKRLWNTHFNNAEEGRGGSFRSIAASDLRNANDLFSRAALLLQSISADNARLREERDEARDSAHNWHAQCEAIATILELHEPECLGFAGEVRAKFATAEARLSEAVEVLKPFAEASANLDDSHPDSSPIWESPAAMGIDAKHLRAAQSFLDTQGGGNG